MSKPDTWMPWYVADFLADTMRLDAALTGMYALLLMGSWMEGGRLPDDDQQLRTVTKSTPHRWKKARPILAKFFVIRDGFWMQKRLVAELGKATQVYEASVENGRKGGRPPNPVPNPNQTGGFGGAEPKPNPAPNPRRTQPQPQSTSSPGGEDKGAAAPLPAWLPADLWRAFKQHRTKLRASMTERAEHLMVKELAKLRAAGHDPIAVLEESIRRGWKGVFPPKPAATSNVSRLTPAGQRTAENLSAWLNDDEEKGNGTDGP